MTRPQLSRSEASAIAADFGLGEVVSLKLIAGGEVNYNFLLRTSKGSFVVRVLGQKGAEKKVLLEADVLDFLHAKRFSMQIPLPLKNKAGDILGSINGKRYWVYRWIEGVHAPLNIAKIKALARALAHYHRIMKGYKAKGLRFERVDVAALERRYAALRRIKPKNDVDRLMLRNIGLFEACLRMLKGFSFDQNILLTHQDIHATNLLWKGDKLSGILDFENLTMSPRINDLAYVTKSLLFKENEKDALDKRKYSLFVREYCQHNPLSTREKDAILPWLMLYNCRMFDWFYTHAFDGKTPNKGCLIWTINTAKGLMRQLGERAPDVDNDILLRKPCMSDLLAFRAVFNDLEVAKQLSDYHYPLSLAQARKQLAEIIDKNKQGDYHEFAIINKGRFVGLVVLEKPSKDKRTFTLGYAIGRRYWNKGIASEAIRRIVKFGFQELKLKRILADNDEDNPASGRVLEKNDFVFLRKRAKQRRKTDKKVNVLYWEKRP